MECAGGDCASGAGRKDKVYSDRREVTGDGVATNCDRHEIGEGLVDFDIDRTTRVNNARRNEHLVRRR